MLIVILFIVALWAMAFLIQLLWKWLPPGDEVRHVLQTPIDKS